MGPRHWRRHPALRRVYTVASLIGLTMAAANLVVRIVFYLTDQPGILAAIQVGATSLFALHFAVTLVVARRVATGSQQYLRRRRPSLTPSLSGATHASSTSPDRA